MTTRTDLRIGDADREATAASLREHYALGRLSLEEFNQRLDAVFAAVTRGQLDSVTRDLPHVTTPHVPLPVAVPGPGGSGGGAGYGGHRPRHSGGQLVMTMVALLAIMVLVWGPMVMHFNLFSWPGRYGVLLAGLLLARSVLRRLFSGRRR